MFRQGMGSGSGGIWWGCGWGDEALVAVGGVQSRGREVGKQWDGWGGATIQFGGCQQLGSGVWT